jgi:hypothetical protein
MRKKGLIIASAILMLVSLQSCKSRPEQSLLQRYFNSVSMGDLTTMSTMAVDPLQIDAASWKIVSVSEEKILPASLPDLNAKELELKKQLEQHVTPTLDAKDTLDIAKDEFTGARTGAAKASAKAKMDEAQKKYDDELKLHQDLQRQYNETKSAAAKEEEISVFSLGAGQLPNMRELKGEVHAKDVEVDVVLKDGQAKKYKITMEVYNLKDEAAGISHRGRWVITKFETL